MAQLICENLSLGYNSQVIVSNLSFCVERGDYLCILGENGSGKTTLMRTILNLQKPLQGTITTSEGVLPDEIGYLPQQTEVQMDFPASVKEIVLSGCQSRCGRRPFYNKIEKNLALENIEKMGLRGLEKRSYRELSGGQQKRVLLARALCATQKMLLLDEPVAALDSSVTGELYEIIKKLNEEGITIIMISHDIEASLKYANKILHVGNKIFFGTKQDYLNWRNK